MAGRTGTTGQNSLPLEPSASLSLSPGKIPHPSLEGVGFCPEEMRGPGAVGVGIHDPDVEHDESTNRRVVERQIISNHLRGTYWLIRNLKTDLLGPDLQQAHAEVLSALLTIGREVLPVLFEELDMIDPYRTDMGRQHARPPRRTEYHQSKPVRPPGWQPPPIGRNGHGNSG